MTQQIIKVTLKIVHVCRTKSHRNSWVIRETTRPAFSNIKKYDNIIIKNNNDIIMAVNNIIMI